MDDEEERDMDVPELGCTLEGPELLRRIQDWRRVTARARSRTLEESSVVSVYPPEADLLDELRRLVEAETRCCSFMEFRIDERADEIVVHLRVPQEMQHVLPLMVDLTTDERKLRAGAV